jgi:CRP-like cAMP-binding protein
VALFQDKLVSIARAVSFPGGARLVRQGEAARGAFLIRTGEVEAQVALPGGGMLTVAELGEGDMFGEMALIERGVCSASVIARSAVEGWFVARDDFRALVASRDPAALEVQRAITRVLAEKLRTLNDKVREHPAEEDRPGSAAPPAGDPLAGVGRNGKLSFDWRSFLPLLPFFERFDVYEREELLSIANVFELPRGHWLFGAGAAAGACFLVVRGAVEIISQFQHLERRAALAGPGELVGYLAVLESAPHSAAARVRENACLLEFPAQRFVLQYQGNSNLQRAVHESLLRALARTNTQLTRLISHARLSSATREALELEKVLHAQVVNVKNQ